VTHEVLVSRQRTEQNVMTPPKLTEDVAEDDEATLAPFTLAGITSELQMIGAAFGAHHSHPD